MPEGDVTRQADPAPSAAEPKPRIGEASPAPALLESGAVFGNRFAVVAPLGEGGMGKVYRVRDRQIEGREVALKVLHPRYSRNPDFRSLFFQEIRAAESFVSEHVVQVRDSGQLTDGDLFLTLDLVEGIDLKAYLKREQSLHPRHALEVARQTLLGLMAGHEKGFVHRDVKPSNLMLRARVPKTEQNPFGVHVQILDFGLAYLAADVEERNTAGTPLYMSPEQIRGERLDQRSDLFAIGVVLYEMVSGSRPFSGTTVAQITESVLNTDLAPMVADLDHVSSGMRKILLKALQKDREQRFQSAAEFLKAVESCKAYRMPRGVPVWVAGALVVTAGAALAEGYLLFQGQNLLEEVRVASERQTRDLEQTNARLRDDLGTEQREALGLKARVGELEGLLGTHKDLAEVDDETQKRDYERERAVNKEQEGRIADLERARINQQEQIDDLQTTNFQLTNELEERERRLAEFDRIEARQAIAFDRILNYLNDGVPRTARVELGLAAERDKLDPESHLGGSFLDRLVACAEGLKGSEPTAADLKAAGDAMHAAGEGFDNFRRESSEWIDESTTNNESPSRLDEVNQVLEKLQRSLQAAQEKHEERHAEDIAVLEERKADPSALDDVLEHVTRYECDHADAFVQEMDRACLQQAVLDGKLDVPSLRNLAQIGDWANALLDGRLDVPSDACENLVRLHWARTWYLKRELPNESSDWKHADLLDTDSISAASPRWYDVLALQVAMSKLTDPAPYRTGSAVYRRSDLVNGDVSWRRYTLNPSPRPDMPDSWILEQYTVHASPLKTPITTELPIRRSGDGIAGLAPDWLNLDLHDSGMRVEHWHGRITVGEADGDLESRLGLDPGQIKAFQESAAADVPCIVFRTSDTERWLSVRFGLVRELTHGQLSIDLAYSDR